ncbi:hypothetical protein Tco_1397543, partial [Tanacetum coccineum]
MAAVFLAKNLNQSVEIAIGNERDLLRVSDSEGRAYAITTLHKSWKRFHSRWKKVISVPPFANSFFSLQDSASELDQGNIAAMTLDRLLLMLGFCLTSIQGCLDADVRECFDVVIGCLDDAIMGFLAAVIMFSYCLIVDF